jgi:hypothetical protein
VQLTAENQKVKQQALKLNQYLDVAVDDLKQSTLRASRSLQANKNDQVLATQYTHTHTRQHVHIHRLIVV